MLTDTRYAWRTVRRSPGFATVVVFTLALAIGANTAVFSVMNGALLKPLPYKDPERLVQTLDQGMKDPDLKTFETYGDFEEFARSAHSFEKLAFATWAAGGATLRGHGPPRNVLAIPVSEDFFSMLGVSAARGRTFEHPDMGRCSVVLSDSFWRNTLAADPSAAGKNLSLDNRSCVVLGIMPPRFEFYPRKTALWMLFTPDDPRPRDRFLVLTFGRLKQGITAAQAQAELDTLHRRLHPADWQRDFLPAVSDLQDSFTFLAGRNLRATLRLLEAAVGFVLLIACFNVANLLLGRSPMRERELAVRAALGSGRARLIRQLFVEGLLLAITGGCLGVGIAQGALRYFLHANPIELPVGTDVAIDWTVLAFTALVTLSTATIFGLAPAWRASRTDLNALLQTSGRGAIHGSDGRLTRGLIAAEIALSLTLLSGAGLLMRSVLKMSTAPLGFNPEGVATMSVTLPAARYSGDANVRLYDDLERRLRAIPGVDSVAAAAFMPPMSAGNYEVQVEGQDRSRIQDTGENFVSDGYFAALRVALRRGRLFGPADTEGAAQVAIVNEAFARRYFPGVDPIGRRIRAIGFNEGPWATIAGVVATEKHPELMREMTWREQPAIYRPLRQEPALSFNIAVRMTRETADSGRAIGRAVADLDREISTGDVESMRERLGNYLKYPRFRAIVLNMFAALALLLAALGLHGLLSQYVARRTREIGLRIAVGATARDVFRLIARQGGGPVLAGIAAGLGMTAVVSGFLTSLLFDVKPQDPATMIAAAGVLIVAACLAMAIPARNAARVDPGAALRDE